ncbi:RING-H2 finger protein ATL2-like [Dioscorea cayenensis subsp. rotundata]|uniref:RING-type E3 ubiquitin transferase n=1 Tax=Dioscorea cayennensis subsp. rotundata TaxID=55577 RepID=A0AB40BQM6_DIOCR|nr:RING-H2 finger protein ATL2-like [Dioscorea cayenensis subsp. rotundata]
MGIGTGGDGNLSSIWTPGGKMTMTAMIIVTALFILLFFHLYSRLFLRPREPYSLPRPPVIRRRPLIFVETRPSTIPSYEPPRGLDPIVIESISPVVVFHNDGEIGSVCAVCLGEIEEGELARIVPKCGHGFHVECIDMWLASHATCPLCRAAVEPIGMRGLGIDSKVSGGGVHPGGDTVAPELDLERGMVAEWAPPVTARRERVR